MDVRWRVSSSIKRRPFVRYIYLSLDDSYYYVYFAGGWSVRTTLSEKTLAHSVKRPYFEAKMVLKRSGLNQLDRKVWGH